ncbi:RNI-like protein [Daldinia sp. FL1419]|nr:RNI-like protein [Daldinia sp. FL1419]
MRPPAPSLDVIAARNSAAAAAAAAAAASTANAAAAAVTAATAPSTSNDPSGPTLQTVTATDEMRDSRDSRSSSSTNSPVPADNEESDFFHVANDSQSSLGVVPNLQDMQVTDPECLPTVAALPSEILISIFSRINSPNELLNCMLTCKRWARNVVEILWHRPTCTSWPKHQSICATLGLDKPYFTYTDFVKRLNLAALADKVSDGSVMPLAVCTRVERLTLTNCKELTDSGLMPLVRSNKSLLALDISGDVNITEQSIFAIAENCKRLQGLNVSNCKMISNESMVKLAEKCRYIKRLKLNDCEQLQDNAIVAFANNCPNILEIDLHQCINIGNEPVTALLAKGRSLRELRLANCDLIDDGAFLSLPPKMYEHLRILDLSSCTRLTDRAVEKIIEVAPRIRNLVLAKCSNITDAAVYAISRLGKNLHYVHLGHCRHITDDAVKRLVQSCNRIRYIDLGCCTHLTDESVVQLARLPKLKRIGLVKCSAITDDSMYALAGANRHAQSRRNTSGNNPARRHEYHTGSLERVHLSYCTNLTLPSIIKLLNCCPKLTHLSLTGVPAFLRDDLDAYCREAPPDFTEHQRAVFCVFSGQGVTGLRDYLNTQPEFAEYHLQHATVFPSRRPAMQINQDAAQAQAQGFVHIPAPDIDGFDDVDGVEDDDMGDGSEIALDPGSFGGNDNSINGANLLVPPPPPPPPQINTSHQPSHLQLPHLAAITIGATTAPTTQSNTGVGAPSNSTAGPSTAGQGIFANVGSSGPSTASMLGDVEGDDTGNRS